jgi:hypothetical protein
LVLEHVAIDARKVAMSRLFQAGLFAAALQLIAIVTTMATAALFLRQGWVGGEQTPPASGPALWAAAAPFLKASYVLTSIGVIYTNNRFLDVTARYIRHRFRGKKLSDPNFATTSFFSQLCIIAFGFAIFALGDPPIFLLDVGRLINCPWFPFAAWPGLWSIGIASFGATARAARRSLD